MDEAKMVAITARMEGHCVVVKNIGKKVKVSEMELVTLCNFAELGLMSVFSELDGESGELAAQERNKLKEILRQAFNADGDDGLDRLSNACAAMLRSPRFEKYIFRDDEVEDGQ